MSFSAILHIFLGLLFTRAEIISPKINDAVIPTADAERPPERMPRGPTRSTASLTPLAMVAPKPMRGTDTPAPKSSKRGS